MKKNEIQIGKINQTKYPLMLFHFIFATLKQSIHMQTFLFIFVTIYRQKTLYEE
jgi:hypothetical protein